MRYQLGETPVTEFEAVDSGEVVVEDTSREADGEELSELFDFDLRGRAFDIERSDRFQPKINLNQGWAL